MRTISIYYRQRSICKSCLPRTSWNATKLVELHINYSVEQSRDRFISQ